MKRTESVNAFGLSLIGMLIVIIAAGCGQSKEEKALERIRNRPPAAFVRLVNLTSKTGDLKNGSFVLRRDIAPGTACLFTPTKAGKSQFNSSLLGEPVEIDIESGKNASIYVLETSGGLKTTVVKDEPRVTPKGQLEVAFLSADDQGKYTVTGQGLEGTKEVPVLQSGVVASSVPGEFKATVAFGSEKLAVDFTGSDRGAYTVVVVRRGGKPETLVLRNHPEYETQIAGAAGGG